MNEKESQLKLLESQIKICEKCRLCTNAKNAVPGEGNFESEIVFIGEAPGAQEDETGRPFVGRAGKFLEGLLQKIDYTRSDVWIGNVVKHRPPNNRDPLPDEIKICEPFLTQQLEVIKPVLIVTLGRFAMSYFHKDGKITRDHGQLIRIGKHNIYPIYHPAAALRNGDFAKALVADFMRIPEVLKEAKDPSKSILAHNGLEQGEVPMGSLGI